MPLSRITRGAVVGVHPFLERGERREGGKRDVANRVLRRLAHVHQHGLPALGSRGGAVWGTPVKDPPVLTLARTFIQCKRRTCISTATRGRSASDPSPSPGSGVAATAASTAAASASSASLLLSVILFGT